MTARSFGIWCSRRASSYGLPDRSGWMQEKGSVLIFSTREAADAKAKQIKSEMKSSALSYAARELPPSFEAN
jgi:hypothetical protein